MQTKGIINPKHDLSDPDLNLSDFSDKDLYQLCSKYGAGIRMLRRIFALLLVEVNRRRLHRKRGFESIYMFAAKVGGMEKGLVDQILWLAEFLKDKPFLWREFRCEGWSKVRVVASVATVLTDKLWAEKVSLLSKPALEELVRDWKRKNVAQQELCRENCKENLFDFAKADENAKSPENLTNTQTNVFNNFPKNEHQNTDLALLKPESNVVPDFGEVNSGKEDNISALSQLHASSNSWVFDPKKFDNSLVRMRFKVSQETEFKFLLFKQRLCKKKKEALTSGEVLEVLLDGVEFKRI